MSIASEGFPFVIVPFAAGAALVVLDLGAPVTILGVVFLLAAFFCLFFFRDPDVKITEGDNLVLSPCNGTVLQVDENSEENIIRVFLSIFNVHLQRAPIGGRVESVEHKKGKFLMAMKNEAHLVNEQNIIILKGKLGTFTVKQIAGFLARRCVSWVEAGDEVAAGEKIGLIKFSSQVDLALPKNIKIKVKAGDKVRAGVTVFGELEC